MVAALRNQAAEDESDADDSSEGEATAPSVPVVLAPKRKGAAVARGGKRAAPPKQREPDSSDEEQARRN